MVKRKSNPSYTQMTLNYLRDQGRCVDICEKYNHFSKKRIDLFGFIDIISLDPIKGVVAVQSTGPSGHSDHKKKILSCEFSLTWLECGGKIELISWRKLLKKRGGKQRIWVPRVEEITLEMFEV